MGDDEHGEDDVDEIINHDLRSIDPTGEIADPDKEERYARIMADAEEFVAGMFRSGKSGQEIMTFGLRIYLLGQLIHTRSIVKALKYRPPKEEEGHDHWMYQ